MSSHFDKDSKTGQKEDTPRIQLGGPMSLTGATYKSMGESYCTCQLFCPFLIFKAFFLDNLLFLILSFVFSRPQESSLQSAEKQLLVFDGTLSLCGHQHAHTLNMYCIH